jgi:hypothetical protein
MRREQAPLSLQPGKGRNRTTVSMQIARERAKVGDEEEMARSLTLSPSST